MIRVKKPPKPTLDQTKWLRRIAQAPMIKTYTEGHQATYSLTTGEEIPVKIAAALIGNGWVKGQRDGMFDDPQSYVALKPILTTHADSTMIVEWSEPNDPTKWDSRIPASAGITGLVSPSKEREKT